MNVSRFRLLLIGFLLVFVAPLACMNTNANNAGPNLATRLATGARSDADKARDLGRRPAAVIEFLGIEPGMKVMDLIASGGYYTEVLAEAVGPDGLVYAQNPAIVLKFRDGASDKAITARLANDRLPNVMRLDREIDDLQIEANSLDAVVTALNFHDIYDGRGPDAAHGMLLFIRGVLRPGGVLGLIDHAGNAGNDNKKLHRIEESLVAAAAEKAGFVVEASGDMLRNPGDDRTKNVFGDGMRGATDRFVLKLRKPR